MLADLESVFLVHFHLFLRNPGTRAGEKRRLTPRARHGCDYLSTGCHDRRLITQVSGTVGLKLASLTGTSYNITNWLVN